MELKGKPNKDYSTEVLCPSAAHCTLTLEYFSWQNHVTNYIRSF